MKYIRKILGAIVIFMDWVTRPKPMERSPEAQADINKRTENMSLYQFHGCPFCVKVRRSLHKLNVHLELRDAKDKKYEDELIQGGGKRKVPCLRIQENGKAQWMYNSKDIVAYLQKTFG